MAFTKDFHTTEQDQGNVLDGRLLAQEIKDHVARQVQAFKTEKQITPGLAVILVGDDPASKIYVGQKEKACAELGIASFRHEFPSSLPQAELLALIEKLNADPRVSGILVQLPLPAEIDSRVVLEAVSPHKDVDGFHPINVGRLTSGIRVDPVLLPCTPAGVMHMIERTGVSIEGKSAVVIGRSNIVGKPVALMLLERHATVTIVHSRTRNLKEIAREADIVVAALGKPRFVTADMVKEGAIVIDVGINRDEGSGENGTNKDKSKKLAGDVDYENVRPKAAWITPVPGGVGPMTIAMLMRNTLTAARGF